MEVGDIPAERYVADDAEEGDVATSYMGGSTSPPIEDVAPSWYVAIIVNDGTLAP